MAKSELLAIYDSVDSAADAVEGLRAAGFADTAVDVIPGFPTPRAHSANRIPSTVSTRSPSPARPAGSPSASPGWSGAQVTLRW